MNDKGLCQFAIESHQKLVTSGNNVVFSPLSAALAIGMVMLGARGQTLDNTGRMLFGRRFNESTLEAAEQQFKHLISIIIEDNEGLCDMANLIYGQQGFPIKPAFQEKLSKVFGVDELKQLDLAKEGKQLINADVNKATRGMIKEMVDEIDPDLKLMLINALYFKGFWKKAFNKDLTNMQDFTLESGEKKQVWMMRDSKGWLIFSDYCEMDDFFHAGREACGVESKKKHLNLKARAALLDYRPSSSQSSSKSIQMLIILPDEGVSLDSIEQQLNSDVLTDLLSSMRTRVKISLPKFKIKATHDLKSIISTLGAEDLFDAKKADLSEISDIPLHVSEAIQKAIIEVDEEGTTAVAVTRIGPIPTSGTVYPPPFVCNRPFWFSLLIDQGAKEGKPPVILFTGYVRDPFQS